MNSSITEIKPIAFNNLEEIISAFNRKTAKSKLIAEKNRQFLADKTSIGMQFSQTFKETYYPLVVNKAAGSYVWDTDGNQYIDILNGLGTNLFGHNPEFVKDSICETLEKGYAIGPQSPLVNETAELFCKITGMERVLFSNTGTEAIMTAIRIARTATQKNKIVLFSNSYHGHSDMTLVKPHFIEHCRRRGIELANKFSILKLVKPLLSRISFPFSSPSITGIPKSLAKDVIVLEYDSPKSLEIIKSQAKNIAAVIVEPVQTRCPHIQPKTFLNELREITTHKNIKLIFDEMVTGFRVSMGGAQQYFDIKADLVTYSKIAGGGLPLSIVAGRYNILDHIDGGFWSFGDNSYPKLPTTFFAGTFCKNPLAISASHAVATELLSQGDILQKKLNQKTQLLVARLNNFCNENQVELYFGNFGSFFFIDFSKKSVSENSLNTLSLLLMLNGIYLRAGDKGGFLSTAHTEKNIDAIFCAYAKSILQLKKIGLLD